VAQRQHHALESSGRSRTARYVFDAVVLVEQLIQVCMMQGQLRVAQSWRAARSEGRGIGAVGEQTGITCLGVQIGRKTTNPTGLCRCCAQAKCAHACSMQVLPIPGNHTNAQSKVGWLRALCRAGLRMNSAGAVGGVSS
jgi:hypothetical protein